MRRTAPVIVGGGPAGATAALALAQAGVRATVLERQRGFGDAICGGFLSWQTLAQLAKLGVTPQGQPIHRVAIFANDRRADALLPGRAIGLSRHTLDTMLLQAANEAGARVECGVSVKASEGATVQTSGGTVQAETLFVATGKHDLRGIGRPRDSVDPTLGLRMRLPAHPALVQLVGDAIELHLFDRGYAGIVLQEDGSANFCLAVRKSRLHEAGNAAALFAELGAGPLGERLAFMPPAEPFDAIGAVPYGWRASDTSDGVWRLGDQAACIPSLAGEGIGIAIASGRLAAAQWLAGANSRAFQRSLARRTARPVTAAHAFWRLAEHPPAARVATRLLARVPALAALGARLTRIGD